jgi:hypothetical protein
MEDTSARAAGLAAVAVAMASPESDLLEIVGEAGRTDLGVSTEAPPMPATLGEAPVLEEPLPEPDEPSEATAPSE